MKNMRPASRTWKPAAIRWIMCSPTTLSLIHIYVYRTLADNDAYHALQAVGGLIRTGATGTNVNDVAVALVE